MVKTAWCNLEVLQDCMSNCIVIEQGINGIEKGLYITTIIMLPNSTF